MWKFIKYRFNKAFEQNLFNLILFLIGVSVIGILTFSTIFFILQKVGLLGEDNFFTATTWQVFNLFFDQNACNSPHLIIWFSQKKNHQTIEIKLGAKQAPSLTLAK